MDDRRSLSEKRAEAGRKGGKVKGRPNWVSKLTPEERSRKMRELRKRKK